MTKNKSKKQDMPLTVADESIAYRVVIHVSTPELIKMLQEQSIRMKVTKVERLKTDEDESSNFTNVRGIQRGYNS